MFYLTKNGTLVGTGYYEDGGFVVMWGSKILRYSPWMNDKFSRKSIVEEIGIVEEGEWVFSKDYRFNSPSTAAAFCLGKSSNGWTDWKDKAGNTLSSVYRKDDEEL